MNASQVAKRTVPLIIVLLIIIGIAVSCTVLNKEKPVPAPSNSEALYFEVSEGGRKFSLTNQEIYEQLKNNYGINMLIEMIDIELLKSGEVDYYNAVTDEEIMEAIEKDKFPADQYPDGKEALTEEELEEIEEEFLENMLVSYGLKNEEEIKAHYRLKLAKKKYATAQLEKQIQEHNEKNNNNPYFSEKEYETQYKADYQNGYWAIIVPFRSEEEGYTLLRQLGITIHEKDTSVSGDFTKWVKKVDGEEVALSAAEVVEAFIAMYNAVNAYKLPNYPNETLTVLEGVQYTKDENGRFVFNTTVEGADGDQRKNEFYFTYEEITKYNSSIQNYLKVSMKNYNDYDKTEVISDQKWFTPTIRSYDNKSLFVFMLKIAEEVAPELDDVRDEVYQKLFNKKLTENFIETEMAKLRKEKGLEIYDALLEKQYISQIKSYDVEYKKTKGESRTLVAKVGGKEISADDLFDYMDERFGMSVALNRINFLRVLNNPELNKIFKYYEEGLSEKERVLDPDKWQEIKTKVRNLRDNFLRNAFATYGFPSTYGWKNFIRDFYGVHDVNEMKYYVLYSEVVTDFTDQISLLEDADEDSDLWKLYKEKMEEIADNYFSSRGIHLLILVNDENGQPIHPDKCTPYQRELAEELFDEIWKYYNAEPGTASEKLQALADLFLKAPRFLAGIDQDANEQPEGFEYILETDDYKFEFAKYKSAGLVLKYEDLGAGSPGKYVKEFEEALREMWKADPTSQVPTPYTDPETGDYKPIITKFGYHGYVNLSSTDISKWYYSSDESKSNPGIIPTLQMIKTYLEDSESSYLLDENKEKTDEEFTAAMKTAITTFYTPLYKELTDSKYVTIQLYKDLQGLDYTFNSQNYTEAEFLDFVTGRIKSYQEDLTYFKVEEE